MEEKLLEGVIPLFDKEEVEKQDLDLVILRLFHGVGQVAIYFQFEITLPHYLSSNSFEFL